jgi:hypothetical protein
MRCLKSLYLWVRTVCTSLGEARLFLYVVVWKSPRARGPTASPVGESEAQLRRAKPSEIDSSTYTTSPLRESFLPVSFHVLALIPRYICILIACTQVTRS